MASATRCRSIFSGTKGLVALCLLMLVDRGELDLDAPVARYWPEFAANGKESIRVLELASHQARLPGIRDPLEHGEVLDDRRMAALLAAQPRGDGSAEPPSSTTRSPTAGSAASSSAASTAAASGASSPTRWPSRSGLEIWIGLPPELERRVSPLAYAPDWGEHAAWSPDDIARDELLNRVLNNPPLFPPDRIPWNAPDVASVRDSGAPEGSARRAPSPGSTGARRGEASSTAPAS